jgi:hypothetical protein
VEPPAVEVPAYSDTGNAFYDAAAGILHEAGFDAKLVADEFTSSDGLSTDTRAGLVAKLGEGQVTLMESGLAKELVKAENAVLSVVHTAAGSEKMWNDIVVWTTTDDSGLTPEGEKQYNDMLAAGGVQAQLAVQALKEAYMASPGFVQEEGHIAGDTGVPAAPAVEMISRAQYTEEKRKAVRDQNAVLVASLEARARYTMETDPGVWRAAERQF